MKGLVLLMAVCVASVACNPVVTQLDMENPKLKALTPAPVTDAPQPTVAEPPKKFSATAVGGQVREFNKIDNSDCANRVYIMTTFVRKASFEECKTKCAREITCTAFAYENTPTSTGECTVYSGTCEKVEDPTRLHSLYVASTAARAGSDLMEPTTTMTVTQPTTEAQSDVPPQTNPIQTVSVESTAQTTAVADPMINVTIVIPTVRRFDHDGNPAPEKYLAPLVTKLWNELAPDQQKYVKFLILNCDKQPEKHTEALSLVSIPSVQVLTKPDWSRQVEENLRKSGALRENGDVFLEDGRQVNMDWIKWVAAEDMDGSYLLEMGARQSPYVLFLEDDIYPTTNALSKLTSFVNELKTDDWLFADLYTPNLDWAPGMLDVQNAKKYNFNCCTQSMLFRSDRVPGIVSYWRSHPAEPVDDNLRNYRQNLTPNLWIYAARPNLFQHVGAYSSNAQKSTGIVEHTSIEFLPLLFQEDVELTPPNTVSV